MKSPQASYILDFISKNKVTIPFDSYDFEGDELIFEWCVDPPNQCDVCFVSGDDGLTIISDASIADMTFNFTIWVSDNDHVTSYQFIVVIGPILNSVTGRYVLSISEDDGSKCLGISSVLDVFGGQFTNAAPCLKTAPELSYELY